MEKTSWQPDSVFLSTELPEHHTNGVNNAIKHLIPQFQKTGINLTIFSPSESKGVKLPFYSGARVAFVPWSVWIENIENYGRPELFHAFAPALIGLTAVGEMKEVGIPLVASFNTMLPDYLNYYGLGLTSKLAWIFFRFLHNQVQLNLAPSFSVKELMEANGIKNIQVWGRGVDSNLFDPAKRSKDWRCRVTHNQPEKPIILGLA